MEIQVLRADLCDSAPAPIEAVSDALESSRGIKQKGLLIFEIWMILHMHTHPCTPADNKNPKKGRFGPLKGITSLEK